MKKIFVLLIYLICYKPICPKPCNSFTTLNDNSWFTECQPPCQCSVLHPQRPIVCAKDPDRECVGCVENTYADTDNCLCVGDLCICPSGERWCHNRCVVRKETCDGKCKGDDKLCNGKCIKKDRICDRKCHGEDRLCNGKCIDKNEDCQCQKDMHLCNNRCESNSDPCDGRCQDEDRVCQNSCIGREKLCNGLCGEKDWYCSSKGKCIPQTETCKGIFFSPATGCANNFWKCNEGCIPEYQACNENCNENLGYWMCGSHCRKGGKDMWKGKGKYCQRNIDTKSDFKFPESCAKGEWKCKVNCIPRNETCDGECNKDQGDWMCGAFCKKEIEKEEWENKGQICTAKGVYASSPTNDTIPLNTQIIIGVSSGFGVFSLIAVIGILLYCRAKDKKERKEIKYIDDNPEYNYGEADDDIEIVDYNDYYGDSDEETHI